MTGGAESGPRRLDVRDDRRWGEVAPEVRRHLLGGGLLAYPTETVYGFGGVVRADAVERLRTLKGREGGKPFLTLVRGPDDVSDLRWTAEARRLAAAFWPGAVTLILGDPRGIFPPGVRSPEGTVAVRSSPHPLVGRLLAEVDGGLTSTSANAPGAAPATTGAGAAEAAAALGAGPELWVLDAGPLGSSPPSTLVDCTVSPPEVRRRGAVSPEELREAVPGLRSSGGGVS